MKEQSISPFAKPNIPNVTERFSLKDQLLFKGVDALIPQIDVLLRDNLTYDPNRTKINSRIGEAVSNGMQVFVALCGHEAWIDAAWMTKFIADLKSDLNSSVSKIVIGGEISAAKSLFTGAQGPKMKRLATPFLDFFTQRDTRIVMVRRSKDVHSANDEKSDQLSYDPRIIKSALIEGTQEGGRVQDEQDEYYDNRTGGIVYKHNAVPKGLQGIHPENTDAKLVRRLLKMQLDAFDSHNDGKGLLIVPFVVNGGRNIINPTSQKINPRAILALMHMYPRNLISATACEPITLAEIKENLKTEGKNYNADNLYDTIMRIAANHRPESTRGDYRSSIKI